MAGVPGAGEQRGWLPGFTSAHFLESTNRAEKLAEKSLHALESEKPALGQALKVWLSALRRETTEVMELPRSPGRVAGGGRGWQGTLIPSLHPPMALL